jgi:DNA invertase Pin-like site-specific DNA recombinase
MAKYSSPEPPERSSATGKHPQVGARVFGYGRASTAKQDLTLDAQESQAKGYFDWKLAPQQLTWVGFFGDKKTSGGTPFAEREAGKVVSASARRGDHIVVTKFDRAFRSLGNAFSMLEKWRGQGVYVHFL